MGASKAQVVLGVSLLLVARWGFSQCNPPPIDQATTLSGRAMAGLCGADSQAATGDVSGGDPIVPELEQESLRSTALDLNRDIYYRNKLEFSLDVGWLPINIPFPLDFMLGDSYNTYPLKYTLVPITASLRWHLSNVRGPWALRGNWDLTFSGSITAIPRGPESRYFAYMMAMRRNFVQRNWKAAPYFDWRAGLGNIDAKGPEGVKYAQGQDFTFTLSMGSGVRYNFNSRYGISAGLSWMHISNANLSQRPAPIWGIRNYGINVVGPVVGLDIRLGGRRTHSEVK